MKFIRIGLFIVILFGLFLRLFGNNWDQGSHMHPDERFLTMVGVDTRLPRTFSGYMDPKTSAFNPANKGFSFYVYGTFPLFINKVFGELMYNNTYETFPRQGRIFSGLADALIILIIYKICGLLEKKMKLHPSIKLFAAFFYAIAVLPIQLSHFFAVDTFLNLFCWLSVYYALQSSSEKDKGYVLNMSLSGIFLGLAFASKISAFYFMPLILIFIVRAFRRAITSSKHSKVQSYAGMITFILFSYVALRVGSPYYFETSSIIDPRISWKFINAILELKSYDNPLGYYPPAVQWIAKSPLFQITNIFYFGVGPAYFILSLAGIVFVFLRKNYAVLTIGIIWMTLFIVFQSLQFAKTMRYMIFIYPFLAIFAAIGLERIVSVIKDIKNPILVISLHLIIFIGIIVWPLAFFSIYTKDHSRITASKWMYLHIPSNAILLSEYWDDPLPVPIENTIYKKYKNLEVHVFDPESVAKWDVINVQLSTADYYIMSSNRGWGSMPSVPKRYPLATKFYKDMFNGDAGYSLIKEFSSYPSLRYVGIPIDFPDQWAEEAFTVYDHPLVKIFKRN